MSPDRRLDDFDNERDNVNGFRLEIPHPKEIHQFIVNEANRRADTPRHNLLLERQDFLEGKTPQLNAINWETILNDQVIKSVEVDLTVTYTPEQGPHCELVLLIFAPQSRITLLAEGINRLVKEQMPNTSLELDHTGEYVMFIRDGSDGELQFVMGHADLQDTISVYGSEEYANEVPYLIKVVGNIVSMEVEEFFNEMKFAERAASLTIDSIYKAHGHKPVDARLELSLDSINRL